MAEELIRRRTGDEQLVTDFILEAFNNPVDDDGIDLSEAEVIAAVDDWLRQQGNPTTMTNIGTIELTLQRQVLREGHICLQYASAKRGYVLTIPRSPHFEHAPTTIEIRIAAEDVVEQPTGQEGR
jgi:hypothetical protein